MNTYILNRETGTIAPVADLPDDAVLARSTEEYDVRAYHVYYEEGVEEFWYTSLTLDERGEVIA